MCDDKTLKTTSVPTKKMLNYFFQVFNINLRPALKNALTTKKKKMMTVDTSRTVAKQMIAPLFASVLSVI